MRPFYDKHLKPKWLGANPTNAWWNRATSVDASELWEARNLMRRRLVAFIRSRLIEQIIRRGGSAEEIADVHRTLRDDALTIGFARRFATYKRATLLFRDVPRLKRLLTNPDMPVQVVIAGKAHPKDHPGKVGFLRRHGQGNRRNRIREGRHRGRAGDGTAHSRARRQA